jgi:nucleoside-diphosphate-sugar epimerase
MIGVTGANGFVGRVLVSRLVHDGIPVTAFVRDPDIIPCSVGMNVREFPDLDRSSDFSDVTNDINVLIHCAARVHVMNDSSTDPLSVFLNANFEATVNLARSAAKSGVARFIFISSIKVNGEATKIGEPFTEQCPPTTQDPYGLSKFRAEKELMKIGQQTGMEVVIIRPALVYGPGVKGNMSRLIKWMGKPVPLPFGAIHNQRSLVALDNLVSFISLCADREKSPQAANQVFLISDGEDVSTTQLLRKVGQALNLQSPSGIEAWLVPVPVSAMTFFAKLLGKGDMANRLFGSLQVDSSKARDLLGWEPVITMDEQLAKMAKDT